MTDARLADTQTSHTPGRWYVSGRMTVRSPNGWIIARVGWHDYESNAALIAAAPRLLAALTPLADAAEPYADAADPNSVQVSIPLSMLRAAADAVLDTHAFRLATWRVTYRDAGKRKQSRVMAETLEGAASVAVELYGAGIEIIHAVRLR